MYAYKSTIRSISALLMFLPVAALAATTITGTVTNVTTNRPAVGDQVTLMSPQQNMQEVTSTTTNAQGQFSLSGPEGGQYLLRVTHDKADYYQSAPEGSQPVSFDVYDAGAHVAGVSTEVLMLRAQTDSSNSNLDVTEDFIVKNASKPPMTQFSKAPFDLYLPDGAVVEATAAKGPNGMPTSEELAPQSVKNLYSVLFPIRPGETQIEVAYHIPYTGNLKLNLKMAGQTDMFAVSLPKSMVFTAASDGQFLPANGDPNAATYMVRSLKPGQAVAFTISGVGQLPQEQQASDQGGQSDGGQAGDAAGGSAENDAPGKGLGTPLDPNGTHEPLSTKYKWWVLGGLGLLLVGAAGALLRKPVVAPVVAGTPNLSSPSPAGRPVAVAASSPTGRQNQLLSTLKEEMFALETDRLQGRVEEAEYLESKAALDLILRRALQRNANGSSTPPAGTVPPAGPAV